jgi:phosphatidylglycerophosphate synthase
MATRVALANPQQPLSEIMQSLAGIQKSNRGAPGYARWVNRKLGRVLAAVAFKLSLTPNQVTIVSAILTFTAITLVAAARPSIGLGVLITLLLVAGFALDAADGQLARLRGGGSAAGEWLDHVIDAVKCTSVHLVVLIGWYRFYDLPNDALLLIPVAFTLQSSVFFFAIILTEQLRRPYKGIKSSTLPQTNEPAPILRSIIVLPADYGLLCLTFLLFSASTVFIVVYSLLMVINVVFLLGACVRWYREMATLD